MVAVFCRVSVDINPEFIENFPVQFDFKGMLKRICEDVGVAISIIGEAFNLEGQWNGIGKAHNMLVSTLAVYGSSNVVRQEQEGVLSQGSRPFSALVEAAEAISRGVELQEQVQKELMDMERISEQKFSTHSNNETCISDVHSVIKNKLSLDSTNNSKAKPVSEQELPMSCDANAYNQSYKESEKTIPSFTSQGCDRAIDEFDTAKDKDYDDDTVSDQLIEMYNDKNIKSNQQTSHVSDDITKIGSDIPKNPKSAKSLNKKSKNSGKLQDAELKDSPLSSSPVNRTKARNCELYKTYPCEECDFQGKSRNAIADHKRKLHTAEVTKCDVCKKIFTNAKNMKRHRSLHNNITHSCDICGKKYKVVKALRDHKKRHDKAYVKPEFKCVQCPKTFCSNYILECHVKSEHLGMKKSFLCQTCGKSFTTKHTLQQHANAHVGIRPYKCKECGKSFSYETALRDHQHIHQDIKKFHCEFSNCNKSFRQRSALKMHEKIHKEIRDFKCPDCNRGFTQKQALQRHLRSHNGVKPFSCKLCLRKFGEASVIRRHLILVHKIVKTPAKWREDIILLSDNEMNTFSDIGQERGKKNLNLEINNLNHGTVTTYTTFNENEPCATRLPPVTAIHDFRQIESYSHELGTAEPENNTQENTATISSQMNYTMPMHHDYVNSAAVSSSQYIYTMTPLQYTLDNTTKTGSQVQSESNKAESEKVLTYTQSNGINLEEAPTDNHHDKSTVQYLQQTADESYTVIDVGKLQKSLEVMSKPTAEEMSSSVSSGSFDQLRTSITVDSPSALAKDTTEGKTIENTESLEGVNMSQFYTYYSTLASQYMNIGQYNVIPNTEATEHMP